MNPSPCVLKPKPGKRSRPLKRGNPGVCPAATRRKKAPNALSRRFSVTCADWALTARYSGHSRRIRVRLLHWSANEMDLPALRYASMRSSNAALYSARCRSHSRSIATAWAGLGQSLYVTRRLTMGMAASYTRLHDRTSRLFQAISLPLCASLLLGSRYQVQAALHHGAHAGAVPRDRPGAVRG